MPPQDLEDAARMLQRLVVPRLVELLRLPAAVFAVSSALRRHAGSLFVSLGALVQPCLRIVLPLLRIPSREDPA